MNRMRLIFPAPALSFGCYAAQFWWIGTASSDPMAGSSWYNGGTLKSRGDVTVGFYKGAGRTMTRYLWGLYTPLQKTVDN